MSHEQRRRFHAYCLGMAKAGTHSMAGLFRPTYRSTHEVEKWNLIELIMAQVRGEADGKEMASFLRQRDDRLRIEFDSSVYNFFVADVLLREFADARFVLLVRDCLSWANSYLNHLSAGLTPEAEMPFWNHWLQRDQYDHAPEEDILARKGLFPLKAILNAWAQGIQQTLATIPKSRLLIVRTHEIGAELPRIASFLGVAPETLNRENIHLFKAKRNLGLLSQIDGGFIQDSVDATCAEWMARLFPEASPLEWAFDRDILRAKEKQLIWAELGAALAGGGPKIQSES